MMRFHIQQTDGTVVTANIYQMLHRRENLQFFAVLSINFILMLTPTVVEPLPVIRKGHYLSEFNTGK